MTQRRWHVHRLTDGLTLARQWPPRFDVSATTLLRVPPEPLSLTRLAHQIRQDLWRMLRGVRGFSPVVVVTRHATQLTIRAGGRIAPPVAPGLAAQVGGLLNDPASNERWIRWAKQGKRP